MNYYITHDRESVNNAGSKAPADINYLCEKMGWSPCEFRTVSQQSSRAFRYINALICLYKWCKLDIKVKKNEVLLYQHPMYSGTQIAKPFLKKLEEKGAITIVLIHDLEHLRNVKRDGRSEKRELNFIDSFTRIIAHNYKMKKYLIEKGLREDKIVCLNIFDYITSYNAEERKVDETISVAIAGNLDRKKCSYIYKFAEMNPELSINLYGANYDNKSELENMSYKGSYKPDELPGLLEAKYGLIWDGDALDECGGIMGDYLRYNNPHKLSLYIVAGIPVIVWGKSAVASFVIQNHCGVVIDTLFELKKHLAKIPSEEYLQMRSNCIQLSKDLKNGKFFTDALQRCGVEETVSKRIEEC